MHPMGCNPLPGKDPTDIWDHRKFYKICHSSERWIRSGAEAGTLYSQVVANHLDPANAGVITEEAFYYSIKITI